MPKVTITYDLDNPELTDNSDLELALNAYKYKSALEDIWTHVFRPNNKHGYNNLILDNDTAYEVIEELMKIYVDCTDDLE
jgi:hypothetical protein